MKLSPLLLDYNEIVVSATKTKEKVYDAPATISLVSQRKIREFAGNDIGSAVSKVKGMDVYQAGNGRTNINTRGFMAVFNGRFVTLMDGKKFTDPIFRTAFNNTFPTIMEDIDRLEIVFGPSSALYGPNAHNGLINIITKHPKDYPGMNFSITSGNNFQSQRLRYAASGKKISYNNLIDLDSGLRCLNEFNEPTSIIIKHTNACGIASAKNIYTAFNKSYESDSKSAFGGIILLNKKVDIKLANKINKHFFN